MIAVKTADLTQNFKNIADIIVRGEKVLISRPKNENLVILTEKEYNEMDKLRQGSSHRQKIAAVKKFIADVAAIKDEDDVLTDTDWHELANIRSQTNLMRKVDL
jgi:antitoxin YefM